MHNKYAPLPTSTICTNSELEDVTRRLPSTFKNPLPDTLMKNFVYEFHSAGYYLMTEVITALRTVVEQLVKAVEERRGDYADLKPLTGMEFMLNLYGDFERDGDVLYEIGVQNASLSHRRCLENLPLTATYSCLRLFIHWVDVGVYDFSTIPFPFKAHLSQDDQVSLSLERLCQDWVSTTSELMEVIQQLVDALKQSEQDITSQVNEATDVSEIMD